MKFLLCLLLAFSGNSLYAASMYEGHQLFCDYANGNLLIDFTLGGLAIHDYNSASDCERSLGQIKKGEYSCDYANGNLLFTPNLLQYHDFNKDSDCEEARVRIQRNLNFCDYANGNLLFDWKGMLIYDFNSASDCQRALDPIEFDDEQNDMISISVDSIDNLETKIDRAIVRLQNGDRKGALTALRNAKTVIERIKR